MGLQEEQHREGHRNVQQEKIRQLSTRSSSRLGTTSWTQNSAPTSRRRRLEHKEHKLEQPNNRATNSNTIRPCLHRDDNDDQDNNQHQTLASNTPIRTTNRKEDTNHRDATITHLCRRTNCTTDPTTHAFLMLRTRREKNNFVKTLRRSQHAAEGESDQWNSTRTSRGKRHASTSSSDMQKKKKTRTSRCEDRRRPGLHPQETLNRKQETLAIKMTDRKQSDTKQRRRERTTHDDKWRCVRRQLGPTATLNATPTSRSEASYFG